MSEYDRGTGYPSLPSVLANIEQLYDVLVDDAYGRFTPEVVRTVRSPDRDPDDWHPELHTANEVGNTVLSQAVRLPRTSRARRLARTVRARRDRLWARARARPVRAAGALGGQSLAVPAGSARAADAERLIRFLTAEPGSQRRLLEAGFAPALREAYGAGEPDCAAAPRVVRRTEAQRVPEGAVRGLPPGYPEFLWCALQEARARPASPYYPAFSRELRQEVAQLLAGGGSLEGTAERLHQSLALALEGRLPP